MKLVIIAIAALALCFPALGQAQEASNGTPIVRLDKSRFALGESVFFWIGVRAVNQGTIPQAYWKTCRLIVTQPDGTQETKAISWPVDGMVDRGWQGGSGLFEKPKPGTYQLQFEFAGEKTAPVPLVVEDLPLIAKIKAAFVFGPDTSATFIVTNNSAQTIRFSHRDGVNGLVWVSLRKTNHSYGTDFFYPGKGLLDQDEPAQPSQGYTNFSWDMAQKVPTITLTPGKTYQQKLSLNTAFEEAALAAPLTPGQYSVTFGTNLQVLIGEPNSSIAGFSPVHIPATATINYTLAPQSAPQH